MLGPFPSKEVMQRPKSTATGDDLNLSVLQRAHRGKISTFPKVFFSQFCLCFPNRREEEEKQPENRNFLPGDFKYPNSSICKATRISEKPLLLDDVPENDILIKKSRKQKHIVNLADFRNKYPQEQLFFLENRERKLVMLAKISEIDCQDEKPRLSSKVTQSVITFKNGSDEDLSNNAKYIKISPVAKSLAYLFKRAKAGVILLITGKEPESFALKSLKKNEQFLFVLHKGERAIRKDLRGFAAEFISSNVDCYRRTFRREFDLVILDLTNISIFNEFFNSSEKNREKIQNEAILALENQIQESLSYSENMVMILPGMEDLGWLLELFNDKKEIFSIEIEIFSGFSKNLELVLVYFGKFNKISRQDTLDYMGVFLNRDCSFHKNKENIIHFLGHLTGKLGFKRVFRYMISAEEMKCCKNATLFQRFLDLIREKDKISVEEQQEYLSHDKKHEQSSSFFENCSAFSFQKKRRRSDTSQYYSKEKTPEFEASLLTHKEIIKNRHLNKESKNSNISNFTEKDFWSFSEDWLENPALGSSTDSNGILREGSKIKSEPKKKGQVREKSV